MDPQLASAGVAAPDPHQYFAFLLETKEAQILRM